MTEKEFYIYGSQRLGYLQDKMFLSRKTYGKTFGGGVGIPVIPLSPKSGNAIINIFQLPGITTVTPIYFGNKRYEISDWLGNVRVVINDKKTPVNTGTTTVSYFPQVINVSDYYSFGLDITERSYSYINTKYRFSFNDKEDIEQRWYQDYGARYYHKALGRFISADPLIVKQKQYAWLSSYQFASNTPIQAKDLDGLEADFKFDMYQRIQDANTLNTTYQDLLDKEAKGQLWSYTFTDANDFYVVASWLHGDARNIDQTPADKWDKGFSVVGMFIPFISGSAVKKILKGSYVAIEELYDAWKMHKQFGEVAIIGRGMEKRVQPLAGFLNKLGMKTNLFKTSIEANFEYSILTKSFKDDDEIMYGTKGFLENLNWRRDLAKKGIQPLDMGSGDLKGKSIYYEMETDKGWLTNPEQTYNKYLQIHQKHRSSVEKAVKEATQQSGSNKSRARID